jgi:zinc protease
MKPVLKTLLKLLPGLIALALATTAHAGLPIQHWTQSSGAQVYLVESPALPMVDIQLDFDAGSRRDPPDKAGLASLTASASSWGVGSRGDQPALDENALSDAWTDLGAAFAGSAGADRMSFSLRSLTYPDLLSRAIALAARQLADPVFPQALWQRDRARLVASLREADTRAATQAARAFYRAVYGTHPYGYEMTQASLERIGVQDMRALHATAIRACRARVSVVGAVSREQVDVLVKQLLADLPSGPCEALPDVAQVTPLVAASEQRIAFASAQAHVLLGQPGIARNDPDYFALLVGNHILGGGGFTARLTEEVREKRGLTYSVYSGFGPGLHAGAFSIGLQTRPDQAQQALALVREVLQRYVKEGPTEAELQAAKNNLVGGFALRLDSNKKLLDNLSNIALHQLPLDYLDTWTDSVSRLTVADVRRAFARVVHPDTMATVVLGAD